MTVFLPADLPALAALAAEGVASASQSNVDENSLNICIFNLMPKKLETELQLSRMLGQAGATVSLTFAAPNAYVGRNAPPGHMERFYRRWRELGDARFDAVVITGAPIETIPFEDVTYWAEIVEILDWTQAANGGAGMPLLSLCWGAQAALYRYYGVPKHLLPVKRFGVYPHRLEDPASPYLRSLGARPVMPVSRWTETRVEDLAALPHLKPLLTSDVAGLGALADERLGHLHVLNHFEYDALTLDAEYRRDVDKGASIILPENYYPDGDPTRMPPHAWRADAQAFYANWVASVAARKG